eukprot:TRINITY_DN20311_c0_g1_i1.p1 TRINITY_DN20311_c0_g1~~TRINITY_DN20311_c0_g1_i1.p1  ORF type:complete len:118 (-),score=31.44 TRINITY_DN20311_c0_g1_i1:150-503(-)
MLNIVYIIFFFFLMIRRPPRSTQSRSSAASDVYKRQFSTIAFGQDSPTQAPKIAIKVTKGETITLDGIKIKFAEVLEDSRCPTNVNCIWAGRAKVKVEVTSNAVSYTHLTLPTIYSV